MEYIELRKIAKQRGVKGYSKLRKAELLTMLRHPLHAVGGAVVKEQSLLDEPVPNIGAPVLQPAQAVKPKLVNRVKQHFGVLGNKIKAETNTFADWLVGYVPEPIRKEVNKEVEALKSHVNSIFEKFYKNKPKIRESKSAIKGFAKQYTVDGNVGTDAITFLNIVKSEVVNLISKNRQTKINLVLQCEMEKVDIKSGEVIDTTAPFVSKTEEVLEGTDVGELYNKASDKILESMAMFQMRGSNWRFKSVNRLKINTVAYTPLKGNSYIPLQ